MLKFNVVRSSSSPYQANFVLIQKKDGTWRPSIDFRLLNAIIKKDVYSLPRIDDTLDSLGKAKLFSTHGYWQVEFEEESCEKTAFAIEKAFLSSQ